MRSNPVVSIIGAGPSGVTIAAYLKYFGIDFRIFGSPMHRWLSQMPKQMFLKSEGCASSLADPTGENTLARYAEKKTCNFLNMVRLFHGRFLPNMRPRFSEK